MACPWTSHGFAVVPTHGQLLRIKILKAVEAYAKIFFAIRPLSKSMGVNAAVLAKKVMQTLFAELVILQGVLAVQKLKIIGFDEGHQHAFARADGAVAGHGLLNLQRGLESNFAAVAAPIVCFHGKKIPRDGC